MSRTPSPHSRLAVAALAAALALAAAPPPAHAVLPVAKLRGSASLTRTSATGGGVVRAASFHVVASFSTDTPGAQPFTVQQAVIYFPDHAGTNGSLFPSCDAQRIARAHDNLRRCPKGSQIGGGTVKASAIQLGIAASGRVAMFNSHRGRSITFNIHTLLPADIDESLDASIAQLHGGRYGEKLTLVVPHSLQEILSGVYVGVQRFDVTIGGAIRAHGAEYSYLKARTCPRRALRAIFSFKDWTSGQTATATADDKVACTAG